MILSPAAVLDNIILYSIYAFTYLRRYRLTVKIIKYYNPLANRTAASVFYNSADGAT